MDNKKDDKTVIKHIIIIIILFLLGTAVLVDTVIGGNIRFYAKWIECGQKPIQLDEGVVYKRSKQYMISPAVIDVTRGNQSYVCTEAEARERGYRWRHEL
ncbi:MAG: hypothetical protein Q4A37_00400 [Candidatus Saccharibacteria bacterium]|nr:hypothetical protein [Candidatus Saccharibacteria bacterium]